ncbi:MAG: hypothetical protein KAI28_07165 [Sphingomonadales bacterium]|nr:hypothetical protein [Sphingomonadales bacterium]
MVEKKAPIKVRFYRFKNRLKEKTAGLGGEVKGISPEALAKAEAALNDMSEDYPDWVGKLIDQLDEIHNRCNEEGADRKRLFDEINTISHDMKGQGGTFGYPLITTFADSLYTFSYSKGELSDNHVTVIKAHIDAMRAVIKGRVSGGGGEIGEQLTAGLKQAIQKHQIR